MDPTQFDRLIRAFVATTGRRAVLRAVVGAALLGMLPDDAAGKAGRGKRGGKRVQRQGLLRCIGLGQRCPLFFRRCCGGAVCRGRTCVCPTGAKPCPDGTCQTCCPGEACSDISVCCGGRCVLGDCCDGRTGVTCGQDEMCCSPAGCKDPSSDPSNCGGCGNTCPAGQFCVNKACVSCRTADDCSARDCQIVECRGGDCRYDDAADGTDCSGGACCDGACIDTATNVQHCGRCQWECGTGQFCVASRCVSCRTAADCPDAACFDKACDNGCRYTMWRNGRRCGRLPTGQIVRCCFGRCANECNGICVNEFTIVCP